MTTNKRIAIFASGNGSNAEVIFNYFQASSQISIAQLFCNNPHALVLKKAKKYHIPYVLLDRVSLYQRSQVLQLLQSLYIDLIVLAGFLWYIPSLLVNAFPKKIINIHPSLLPKFGGKGMYGIHVHEAVLKAKEKKTGITIHYVNEIYDAGTIILQKEYVIQPDDTPHTLQQKIQQIEHQYYAPTIASLLKN